MPRAVAASGICSSITASPTVGVPRGNRPTTNTPFSEMSAVRPRASSLPRRVRRTAWYAAADLFAFPTLHDPWGLVVNEAMAFGLPIVATDAAGCAPDLVQGNGLVVPAGNVDALAAALAQLLTDEALRCEMGQRSRAIIADYTVEAACSTFLRAIHHALEKR